MNEENFTNNEASSETGYDYTDNGFNTPVGNESEGGMGMAIASMVLGIVAIVLLCCNTYISMACAIVGLILGIMHNKKNGKHGMAIAGIVCSIVALVISVIAIIVVFAFVGAAGSAGINELLNELQQYQ